MRDLREIIEACRDAARRGEMSVLATVVQVAGSAYRRPGARMLFPGERRPVGLVSGGCLEADLAERAARVRDSGESRTVVYDMRSPDDIVWGLGLGCNGEIRVLLERVTPDRFPVDLEFIDACHRERVRGVVATVFDGRRLTLDAAGRVSREIADPDLAQAIEADAARALDDRSSAVRRYEPGGEVLLEYIAPPIRLLVFGAGMDAEPVVQFATQLGWDVRVQDHRAAFADRERFPGAEAVRLVDYERIDPSDLAIDEATAVVVMTHHFLNDARLLRALLPTPAPYVGFIGPRKRIENLLVSIGEFGVTPTAEQLRRLYGPVGIDIGSETPQEIALSLVAEIQAVFGGRGAGFLRERGGPLHDWQS